MMESKTELLITVTPGRVWEILNREDERARLDAAALPGSMGRLQETGRSDGARLSYAWPGSTITIDLEPVPQTEMPPATFTRVRVAHTGIPTGSLPDCQDESGCWGAVWSLWLRNLKGLCERAELPGRYNYDRPVPPVIEQELLMDAPADRVWQAIADPELRRSWLGVELGEMLEREEGRRAVFGFTPEPLPTRVTFALESAENGQQTRVRLRHEGLAEGSFDHALGWHDYLVGLYQATARPLIRSTEWVAASPERIWGFMASQEGMRQWWNAAMTFESKLGGKVYFESHGGRLGGRVVALEANRRLAFTWTEYDAGYPEPEPLLLTVDLVPEGTGTQVTLTHAGFENLPEAIREREWGGYQRGWAARDGLVDLKRLAEAGSEN